MNLEPRLTEQIVTRLEEYLKDPDHDALNLRQLAGQFKALPLCIDWEKCWALKPTGEVVVFSHEGDSPQLAEERDVRMINVALFQGSLTYPEIKPLVPARPSDARDCPFCTEKGIEPQSLENQQMICYCGGLGWVPEQA
ncbi:MAG: hypothetical protein AB1757_02795 [Acidobacteriota bacterium]